MRLEYLDVNHAIVTASELAYPFMLKIAAAHSKISPEVEIAHRISSEELSLEYAGIGEVATTKHYDLEYSIPNEHTDLLHMLVSGKTPLVTKKKQAKTRASTDPAFKAAFGQEAATRGGQEVSRTDEADIYHSGFAM